MPDEPRLEPVLVADPEFLDAGLRGGRLLPLVLRALVAADVNELPREQPEDFLEDALEEAQGVVSGGEYVLLMPQVSQTEREVVSMTSVLPSSGYAAMAACECPGTSISGTTVICRSAA